MGKLIWLLLGIMLLGCNPSQTMTMSGSGNGNANQTQGTEVEPNK